MKLHYSQTELFYFRSLFLFYIPMKLHYSQTAYGNQIMYSRFYIPMKLHYSQTALTFLSFPGAFYIPMKSHYSQTAIWQYTHYKRVVISYKIYRKRNYHLLSGLDQSTTHYLHVIPISLFLYFIWPFIPCRIYLPIKLFRYFCL